MKVSRMRRGVKITCPDPEFDALRMVVGLGLENLDSESVAVLRPRVRDVLKSRRWRKNPLSEFDLDKRPDSPPLEAGYADDRGYWAAHGPDVIYAVGTSPRAAERAARKASAAGLTDPLLTVSPIRRTLYRDLRKNGCAGRKFTVQGGGYLVLVSDVEAPSC